MLRITIKQDEGRERSVNAVLIGLGRHILSDWVTLRRDLQETECRATQVYAGSGFQAEQTAMQSPEPEDHCAGLKSSQDCKAVKPSGALWGSQAGRPFCPPFLVGKTPASITLPEFQRADSNSC